MAASGGRLGGADFVVTPNGTVIPMSSKQLLRNLDTMVDVSTNPSSSRKFIGSDSNGPLRVRIEKLTEKTRTTQERKIRCITKTTSTKIEGRVEIAEVGKANIRFNMTGRSEDENLIHGVYWPDAELENVSISYETVEIRVLFTDGIVKRFTFDGYIGVSWVGFWDENVIDHVSISNDGPFLEQCLAQVRDRYNGSPPLSGSKARNEGLPREFTLSLVDGCQLHIAAMSIRVNEEATDGDYGITVTWRN